MAITNVVLSNPAGISQYIDTAIGSSLDAIKASSTTLYSVIIDNSANGGAASYVKIFNVASGGVTLGSTAPDMILYIPAGAIEEFFFYTKAALGMVFGTALTAACVTTGGTSGTTPPVSSVVATFLYA